MSAKPFDQLPAWMTWVDVVEKYGDTNCRCGLCVAFRAWIQQSAERTETQLMELENDTEAVKKMRDELGEEEWGQRVLGLAAKTRAAEVKLSILLQGWAKTGEVPE
jgi:hypothetical protein